MIKSVSQHKRNQPHPCKNDDHLNVSSMVHATAASCLLLCLCCSHEFQVQPEDSVSEGVKVKGKYRKAGAHTLQMLKDPVNARQVIDGTPFECYGAHAAASPARLQASSPPSEFVGVCCQSYPFCYLTAACAIGALLI